MSNTLALILLIIGVALVIGEVVIPGFGVMGIGGLAAVITSIVLYSTSVKQAVILITIAVAVILGMFVISMMLFSKKSRFVLENEERPDEGYVAARIDKDLVGKEGIAETDLHPSGAVRIDGKRINVISDGEYISKGQKIKVLSVTGSTVKVAKED